MTFLDYIDERFTIAATSSGKQLKLGGSCPFCGESRPDLRLYVSTEDGHQGQCFHCGKGFNAITFIMANEGCSGSKAFDILNDGDDPYLRTEEELPEAVIHFPKCIPVESNGSALTYLGNRSIKADMVKHFDLRYCVEDLTIGETLYRTSNRVIIPIYSIEGALESWQGRDTTGRSSLRYLFPPGFKGAEYLYNAHAIPYNPDYLIVGEGAFDAYGWHRAGLRNVVATFGKKISGPQMEMIRAINPKVVFIAWDGDAANKKFEFCENYGHLFDVRIVDLGEQDADEMKKDALLDALLNATAYDWSTKILTLLK